MARKRRVHYPGAVYHVVLRGNGGQDIFLMMMIDFILENCQGEIEETLQNTPLERSESRASTRELAPG